MLNNNSKGGKKESNGQTYIINPREGAMEWKNKKSICARNTD